MDFVFQSLFRLKHAVFQSLRRLRFAEKTRFFRSEAVAIRSFLRRNGCRYGAASALAASLAAHPGTAFAAGENAAGRKTNGDRFTPAAPAAQLPVCFASRGSGIWMVFDPVAGDVHPTADPHVVKPLHIIQKMLQPGKAAGPPDQAAVRAHRHHAR